jgi:hypothetical protein
MVLDFVFDLVSRLNLWLSGRVAAREIRKTKEYFAARGWTYRFPL